MDKTDWIIVVCFLLIALITGIGFILSLKEKLIKSAIVLGIMSLACLATVIFFPAIKKFDNTAPLPFEKMFVLIYYFGLLVGIFPKLINKRDW